MLPFPAYSNNGLFRLRRAYPGTRRQRWLVFKPFVSPEFRLFFYVIMLYAVFITWGYLQEKIASAEYDMLPSYRGYGVSNKWNYAVVLNVFMSLACTITAAIVEFISESNNQQKVPFLAFWKVAITSALASPIGYESLKYISFPTMILSKSSKHVPVMVVGKLFYNRHYAWYKYVSVALVCMGISLFTSAKSQPKESDHAPAVDSADLLTTLYGLLLVMINLSLDGVTNNEQDHMFAEHGATSLQMMKNTNCWQAIYLSAALLVDLVARQRLGALFQATVLLLGCPQLKYDILGFCFCACIGQVLLFGLIREFGSLVWITVSVTRQLFTIMLSVFLFHHPVNNWQWSGVASVFIGLAFEIFFSYRLRPSTDKKKDDGVDTNACGPGHNGKKIRTESVESVYDDEDVGSAHNNAMSILLRDNKKQQ